MILDGILTWTQKTNRSGFPEYFHIREIRPTDPPWKWQQCGDQWIVSLRQDGMDYLRGPPCSLGSVSFFQYGTQREIAELKLCLQ